LQLESLIILLVEALPEENMLFQQAMDRIGSRRRWIAGLSLLAFVGAGWVIARPAKSHSTALAARPLVKGSAPAAMDSRVADPTERARIAANFGSLPLSFEPNLGQTDPQVKFLSRNSHYNLFLTSNEAVFTLPVHSSKDARAKGLAAKAGRASLTSGAVMRITMLEANAVPQIDGSTPLGGHSNYFHGSDASQWVRDVPQYARVNYRGIYPGVDLTFYGQDRQLEFDFVVTPGADPTKIALAVAGAKKIQTDAAGDLVMTSAGGDLRLHKPVAYQQEGDTKQPVDARFVVRGTAVALAVGNYDSGRELVIDPTVSYSTYKGGGSEDQATSVALDSTGNAYITGEAGDNTFPHTASGTFAGGLHDAFLVKLGPTGTQVYSTLFGGSGDDSGNGIALDGAGGVYVAGGTKSLNFPGVAGKFLTTLTGTLNAFVAKLDATTGALTFATYLGGSTSDAAEGVAADSTGQVYVVGQTQSTNFPTLNAFQTTFGGNFDAFVTVLNPTFTSPLVYSTYLGGAGLDVAAAIALDANKKIYVTGNTSGSFPVTGGVFQGIAAGNADAFVAKLDPTLSGAASLIYSTYLGGSGEDIANGIAVDPSTGFAYVTGSTASSDFPLQGAAFGMLKGAQDAFVTELNATATAPLKFSTYLGGMGSETGVAIALDGSKNVYVTGQTSSTDFPTASPTQAPGGGLDAFVSEFNPSGGALLFSTYLGGSGSEDFPGAGVLGGIAVDSSNDIVVVGDTNSTNFPTTSALQSTNGGGIDAFITKYAPSTSGGTFTVSAGALSSTTIALGSSATSTVTVTSISGFTGAVALTCAVAPATSKPPGCSVSPASVTLTANGNQPATVTISTVKPSVVAGIGISALWLPMPGLLLLGVGFATKRSTRRKITGILLTCIALVGLVFMASCGSGNGGGGGGNPGTTTGSYTATVNGSGGGANVPSNALSFTVQ
jgi:Beta-propeller repeat